MSPDYVASKHDIGLLRADGTTKVGLMLAKDKNGVPIYESYDDEYLANQQFTDADYAALPPEKEIAVMGHDWRSGMGQEIYDVSDPKRYFASYGADLRFKDMAILGPLPTTVTKPTAPTPPTITNADMELTTGWSVNSRTNAKAHGGTYSWIINGTTNTQTITTTSTIPPFQNLTANFTCWAWVASANAAKLQLNDGVKATVTGTAHTGSSTWEQISVSLVLSPNATQIQLILFATGAVDVYFDDAAITFTAITDGAVGAMAEYNSSLYAAFGRCLAKLNGAGTAFTFVHYFPAAITSLKPYKDGYLYIGTAASTVIEDCEDVWNELVDGDVTATLDTGDYKVGSGSNKFVCADGLAATDIIATEAITSTDISAFRGVKYWIKSTVTTVAGDLRLLLDNNASCASPIENLSIPALTANIWTHVYQRLANPQTDIAIISVGLKYEVDIGAVTINIDDIETEDAYWYMDSGEIITQSTINTTIYDSFAKFFEVNGATLWKGLLPNNIYSSTSPTNSSGAWSAVTTVDSPLYNITHLLSSLGTLYIRKTDKLFYLTAAGVVTLAIEDTKMLSGTSGGAIHSWQDKIYTSYGPQSLIEYASGIIDWIDPAKICSNLGDFDGQIQGISADEEWLFTAIDNDTKVEIVAIREQLVDTVKWVYHPIAELTLAGCNLLFMSSIYKRRLWIASTDASNSFYYIPIYGTYGDPTTDTDRSFQTGGYFITPYLHANFRSDSKAFYKITLTMDDTTSTVYWRAYYQKLGDADWTEIASTAKFKTSPTTSVFIPASSTSVNPISTMMRFKFEGVTGASTTTPKLLAYDVRAILYPSKRKLIKCAVLGTDGPLTRDGQGDAITGAYIKTVLDEAEAATWPVTFYDPFYQYTATAKTVKFLPMREVISKQEKEPAKIERLFYLTLQEVSLS